MSLLSRLFGKSEPKVAEATVHNDYRIYPQPVKDGATYRIAARIEKTFGTVVKTHNLIRADTRTTLDEATEASILKARQAIDQLGDALFS